MADSRQSMTPSKISISTGYLIWIFILVIILASNGFSFAGWISITLLVVSVFVFAQSVESNTEEMAKTHQRLMLDGDKLVRSMEAQSKYLSMRIDQADTAAEKAEMEKAAFEKAWRAAVKERDDNQQELETAMAKLADSAQKLADLTQKDKAADEKLAQADQRNREAEGRETAVAARESACTEHEAKLKAGNADLARRKAEVDASTAETARELQEVKERQAKAETAEAEASQELEAAMAKLADSTQKDKAADEKLALANQRNREAVEREGVCAGRESENDAAMARLALLKEDLAKREAEIATHERSAMQFEQRAKDEAEFARKIAESNLNRESELNEKQKALDSIREQLNKDKILVDGRLEVIQRELRESYANLEQALRKRYLKSEQALCDEFSQKQPNSI